MCRDANGGGQRGHLALYAWAPGFRGPLQLLFVCDVAKHCQCTATLQTIVRLLTSSTCAMEFCYLFTLQYCLYNYYALYTKAPPFFSLHSVVS